TKFKTRRVGKRKIQNQPNWNLLDESEKQGFLNQVEAIKESGELTDILEEVKRDRKSTRLNSSHLGISYAVFCLKKKKQKKETRSSNEQSHVLIILTISSISSLNPSTEPIHCSIVIIPHGTTYNTCITSLIYLIT